MAQIVRKVTFADDGAPAPRMLAVGMEGDNNARLIKFAVPHITEGQQVYVNVEVGGASDAVRLYPDADGLYGWSVEARVLNTFGGGYAQVKAFDALDPLKPKWQSGRMGLSIGASMDVDTDLSYQYPTAIEQMEAEMQRVEAATKASEQAAAASATAAAESAGDAADSADEAADQVTAAKQVLDEVNEAGAQHTANAKAQAEAAAASAGDAADSADAAADQVTAAKQVLAEVNEAGAQHTANAQAQADAAAERAAAARSAAEAAEVVTGNLDSRYVKQSDYTSDDVLGKVKEQDGAGSGLDADMLDGHEGSWYAEAGAVQEALAGKAESGHGHEMDEVSGLSEALEGKAAKTASVIITAKATDWNESKTQTLGASCVTTTNNIVVGLAESATAAQREACRAAMITPTAQAAGSITLTCDGDAPGVDLPISILILG